MNGNVFDDIFKKGVLVQLSSSVWQCSKTIEQSVMGRLSDTGNVDWLKGRKYLIKPEILSPIRTAVATGRNIIKKYALPFPINSIYLVPKDSLSVIDEKLQLAKVSFWDKEGEFEAIYEEALEEARDNLGELFDETDYPQDIRRKFNFEWRYISMGLPNKSMLLSPDIYNREKEKFLDLMEETRELAVTALREEFSGILAFMVERLSGGNGGGKPKVITDSMFNRLQEFLADFENRNLFQDDKLAELTEQAKVLIDGASAYNLKYNKGLRENIHKEMSVLKQSVDAAIIDMPRRKIYLPEATA